MSEFVLNRHCLDFFDLVDIDGDGFMEWSEFVMFVIELVVKDECSYLLEELELVARHTIQPAGSQSVVQCCKYIPALNKICLGVGHELQIFDAVENSSTWLSEGVKMKLKRKPAVNIYSSNNSHKQQGRTLNVDEDVEISDLLYIESRDVLAVLRTDLCIEFFKFTSRTKASAELILSFGFHMLPRPYNRIACRDKPKETLCLFGVSSSPAVDCWEVNVGKIGPVQLEKHLLMEQHTDFVRDIVIMHNDSYSLLATGSLDKTVNVWDLDTLKYRVTRTGFSAGVQCVAFDGKSILLAGSFDYQIIGWDLDAHINKPLFSLWGHMSSIVKVVAFGAFNRCFSLDSTGVIKMWDISKASATDKEGRLIDSVSYVQDRAHSFDLFPKSVSQFPTLNGLIVIAQGRHQHVYKVKDTSTKVSAPICVLFSLELMMVITVHAKDVVFWSTTSGEERNKMSNFVSSEALVATLDNRKRKLVVGSSNGVISIFNCLKAAKIKSFPPLPSAVRFLVYTPDKTIVVISGVGDLSILDDLVSEDHMADSVMRECRAHDSDVVSLAFSHPLGLIATADCVGNVVVWDYQFLTPELIIPDSLGAEVGQVVFMDPFPFLLVCDNVNGFTLFPVGPALASMGRVHWKVSPTIHKPMRKTQSALDTISLLEGATTSPSAVEGEAADVDEVRSASPSQSQSPVPSTSLEEERSEHEAESGFGEKRKRDYLRERNEVKCVSISHNFGECIGVELEMSSELCISTVQLDGASTASTRAPPVADLKYITHVPSSMHYAVFTGHEDGTISSFDFTKVLREINHPAVTVDRSAPCSKGYDPRKVTAFRVLRSADYARVGISETEAAEGERLSSCYLLHIWHAHKGVFPSMVVVGDDKDILTAGEDSCVNLFSKKGILKGVLTRGKDVDMIFKPRWKNPIDMAAREALRTREAKRLIKLLNLKRSINLNREIVDPFSDDTAAIRRAMRSKVAASIEAASIASSLKGSHKDLVETHDRDRLALTQFNEKTPARELLIGQLRGKVTYELSSKDYVMLKKRQAEEIAKRKTLTAKQRDLLTDKTPGTTYLNELLRGGVTESLSAANGGGSPPPPLHGGGGGGGGGGKKGINPYLQRNYQPFAHKGGQRQIKNKYDLEIEQIEMSDPANWEITSHNRQRALYENMYQEMTRSKLTKDPLKIIAAKLNALSPNGDFHSFAETIRTKRGVARKEIKESLSLSPSASQTTPHSLRDLGFVGSERSGSTALSYKVDISPPVLEALSLDKASVHVGESDSPRKGTKMDQQPHLGDKTPLRDLKHIISPRKLEPLHDLPPITATKSPLRALSPPTFACKADKKAFEKERARTLQLMESFESQVKVVEKVYKKAKRQSKKIIKGMKASEGHTSSNLTLTPTASARAPLTSASATSLSALRRHTSAQILIKKQSSVDGLMEVRTYTVLRERDPCTNSWTSYRLEQGK